MQQRCSGESAVRLWAFPRVKLLFGVMGLIMTTGGYLGCGKASGSTVLPALGEPDMGIAPFALCEHQQLQAGERGFA